MGMRDWYRPNPAQKCPFCGSELRGWQGKDGPGLLLVWEQYMKAPVDQMMPEDEKLGDEARSSLRLPETFMIYTQNCRCDRIIYAACRCTEGVWVQLELLK